MEGLPPEAATWRQDNPGWDLQHELTARVLEHLDHYGRIQAHLFGAKKTPPVAQWLTHPGRPGPAKAKPISDPAEIRKFFQQHITERG